MLEDTLKHIQVIMEPVNKKPEVKCEVSDSEKCNVSVKLEIDEDESKSQRENRLTTIIDQLRCQSQMKGNTQRESFNFSPTNGENGGGNVGRRYACEPAAAAAPAPTATSTPAPAPATPAIPPPNVKYERLSPHESNTSRSRSVTPSTPSYPGTPPERGSPHAPGQPGPSHLPRNCSDIMRSLAARYNPVPTNNYFHRVNGFSTETRPSTSVKTEPCESLMGGLFSTLAKQQGGPPRLPAFPPVLDMNSTKTMLAISRLGRSRRKRVSHASTGEYSPLDLSAASCENAAKRARLSESPSTRSDNDDRDRGSNGDRSETHNECLCAEARARLQAWSVDEVCDFVNSIDICAEYSSAFREQRIDGGSLPLLTEQHLTKMLQMKLGPALKLRAVVAARLEPCAHCQSLAPPVPSTSAASPTSPVPTKINGTSLKTERNTSPS